MVSTTPFHERLSQLNTSGLYGHWAGYLSALRYSDSAKHEYFAIRNSAGFFDSSPLYKYAVSGPDAEKFLAGVLTRDIRTCAPGRAQYTVWCDDAGYVLEDGVVFRRPVEGRHTSGAAGAAAEYLLTAAHANIGYLNEQVRRLDVQIEDVSERYGVLAVQGPRSRAILGQLTDAVAGLAYFELAETTIAKVPVTISRTGFTGDLGFEIFVEADNALTVLDAVIAAGDGYGLRPFGEDALLMARIEAGLSLIDVEFSSARYAYTDHERFTPDELGFGWMLPRNAAGIEDESRPFIGRRAILAERAAGASRWATVGLKIDAAAYHKLYFDAGLMTRLDETPVPWESLLYDAHGEKAGYATSLMYSPMLQTHIAIARVRPDLKAVGTTVHLEQTIHHEYTTVPAQVARMPLFNPSRKTD
ncbi:MAG: aminomethyltransferase family protein [Nocardioides sp.]